MRKQSRIIYLRLLIITTLAIMVFPSMGIRIHPFTIVDRTQPISKPSQLWNGLINHQLQPYLEQRFLDHIGNWRSFLIKSYNEAKHFIFPTRPNNHYIWTRQFGYYPVDSIKRINYDVLHRDGIVKHYQKSARRLRILQSLLANHEVILLVIVAPPKVRIYPEFVAPYLIAPAENILSRSVSYGDVLEDNGINVINAELFFREKKNISDWPFFTTTSFHWSFWAGCTVTEEIMSKAEALTGKSYFSIDCSNVDYGKSRGADNDIAAILNIFSTNSVVGDAPFPKFSPQHNLLGEAPKIAVIGDSFSDQIVYALTHSIPDSSWSPNWLTRYDSFISRQTFMMGGKINHSQFKKKDALAEILSKDMVFIEVSDGNIYRNAAGLNKMEFGSTQILLGALLEKNNGGNINPKNILTSGWRPVGYEEWATTDDQANLAVCLKDDKKEFQLLLDVENLDQRRDKPQVLTIFFDGKQIDQKLIPQGRGLLNITVPNANQSQDPFIAEISLRHTDRLPLNLILHKVIMADAEKGIKTEREISTPKRTVRHQIKNSDLPVIDFIRCSETSENIVIEGLSGMENSDKESWRWALGPATRLKFYIDPEVTDISRNLRFKFRFQNGASIPNQTVTVKVNGKEVRHFSYEDLNNHQLIDDNISLVAKKGVNVLEIIYGDWNYGKNIYAPHDPRKLAIVFTQLLLKGYKTE